MKDLLHRIRKFIERYERHLASIALFAGFVLDIFTLRRIDLFFENFVLISYLVIAAIGIVLLNLYETKVVQNKFLKRVHSLLPIAVQFAFGGLFSAFLIFYYRSSSIVAGWPFVILLLILFVANEKFKRYYERLTFHISVYFFSVFLFFIFYVPIVVGRMGDIIFLLSGLVSLVFISLMIVLIRLLSRDRLRAHLWRISLSIGALYVFLNILYFTNIIPPIPLSLREVSVYHSVTRTSEGYTVIQERDDVPFGFLRRYDTVHVLEGKPIFVYSAVFAPTSLTTRIVHNWQHYDEQSKKWVSITRSEFPIQGGRGNGYRGYSWKSNIIPGLWRVNVETPRGQLIGRIKFRVERVDIDQAPVLEAIVKSS